MTYIYACISDNCMRPMEQVKKTRKYKKVIKLSKLLNIENIVIDICSSWNREKNNLYSILSIPENIIVVPDISCLGKKDEISSVYKYIIESNNDILICCYNESGLLIADEMSTVSMSLERKKSINLYDALDSLDKLSFTQYKKSGANFGNPEIVEFYWEIEKGNITQRQAIEKLGINKTTFIKKIKEYIGTSEWVNRYLQEWKTSDIRYKPVKLGGVSEKAKKFYQYLENNKDEPDIYGMATTASFAGIDADIWEKITILSTSDEIEYNKLYSQYTANAYHLYRQVLRYREYLKNLKYRK